MAEGHEVEVIRAHPQGDGAPETVNGVPVHSARQSNIYWAYGPRKPAPVRFAWHMIDDRAGADELMAQRIETFRPDVLHSNTLVGLGADIWRVAQDRNVPVVHTLHDYYLTCARASRFSGGKVCATTCVSCSVLTRTRRRRTRSVSAVVGVSQRIIDIHQREQLFHDTPIRAVVRNASPWSGPVPRDLAGPGGGAFSIGFMGRPHYEKGISQLVQAVARLPAGMVRLVIACRLSDDEKEALCKLAAGADILFLGYVQPDVLLSQVDIVIAPSLWEEPGALVIEEALSAGRPVIVSPYGGSPEAIEPGINGWIVAPEPDAMASLLATLARELEKIRAMHHRLMARGARRTMADVDAAYREIYDRAIAAARAGSRR